jgi:hypothetical protein
MAAIAGHERHETMAVRNTKRMAASFGADGFGGSPEGWSNNTTGWRADNRREAVCRLTASLGAPSNKRMNLTKLVATPGERMEVLPRAFRRFAAVRTASQLIPGVRRTRWS